MKQFQVQNFFCSNSGVFSQNPDPDFGRIRIRSFRSDPEKSTGSATLQVKWWRRSMKTLICSRIHLCHSQYRYILYMRAALTSHVISLMNLITLLKINQMYAMFQFLILCFSTMNNFLPILMLEPQILYTSLYNRQCCPQIAIITKQNIYKNRI